MRDFHDTTRKSRSAARHSRTVYRRRRAGFLLAVVAVLGVAAWATITPFSKADPLSVGGVEPREAARSSSTQEPPSGDGQELAAAPETTTGGAASGAIEDEQDVAGVSEEVSQGTVNVLVLGVDRRPGDQVEGYGTRTDTMMLVQIEPQTGKIELLSIPRDMYVETEPGVKDKINAAYNYGGIDRARSAVENFTAVSIDHYAIVDFRGFVDVVDTMGGVQLEVMTKFPPNWKMEQGEVQTLDGRHALLYARYRGTPRADLERIERQQQLVAALRSQALSWESITKLPEYVRVMDKNIETDMGLKAAVSLGRLLLQHGRNAQMTATQLKGEPTTLDDGNQVLVPKETENEIILQKFYD